MKKTRISKFLANCGIGSRRKCEEIIKSGKVKVNGRVVTDLAFKVSREDEVKYKGKTLEVEDKIVLALNKPAGYLSTVEDDFNRKTVLDLIDIKSRRLYPVGRLDFNSRGLIIITNDGRLTYRITHPKFEIPKTYEVTLNSQLTDTELKKIKAGIKVGKRKVNVKSLQRLDNGNSIKIEIVEGRKRILRRLFSKIGYKVVDLKRVKIGNYRLKGLREGKYKALDSNDIKCLLAED